MIETSSLNQLKETLKEEQKFQESRSLVKKDAKGRIYATGKRKEAIARVWIKPGRGLITVNGRHQEQYFGRTSLRFMISRPFEQTSRLDKYDVWCEVKGSGLSGQAGAIRHGISKALQLYEPELRPALKHAGLLVRDSRRVERKKCGLRGARRAPQFSKR